MISRSPQISFLAPGYVMPPANYEPNFQMLFADLLRRSDIEVVSHFEIGRFSA